MRIENYESDALSVIRALERRDHCGFESRERDIERDGIIVSHPESDGLGEQDAACSEDSNDECNRAL